MDRSLQDFLRTLDAAGELHRIPAGDAEVSPILEIAELADRQSKSPCAAPSRWAARFDPRHGELGGKALLIEKVTDCDFPVAINVYGSYRRMELALGCEHEGGFESIAARIAVLTKPQPPRGLRDMLDKARQFLPLLRVAPRLVRFGPCQEVVKLASRGEVDLTRLPLIKCWPLDGDPRAVGYEMSPEQAGTAAGKGRYITFAGMHTIHADDDGAARPASHNIGMYRAQLIDATHLVMHWHIHHDGAAHWRSWKRAGRPMPIAICLGGEAVLPYAATAPLPPGVSELLMAGFLNGRGIPMVRARTVPLRVPANSEIVIEGWVSTECGEIGFVPKISGLGGVSGMGVSPKPGFGTQSASGMGVSPKPGPSDPNSTLTTRSVVPPELTTRSVVPPNLGPGAALEGPFGDHTGYYSLPDRYPIVNVTAITHRRNAIFPAIIVGPPPQEDYYLGKATERIFLPLLKTIVHDIDDYHLPLFGCFHNCAFIRIRKSYALQARRVMHAVWGAGQMSWTKLIIVVDEDVDVHDEHAVLRAVFENCDFKRDIELVNGPLDILDHAAPRLGAGCKLGLDATRKITGEEVNGVPVGGRPVAAGAAVDPARLVGMAGIASAAVPAFGLGRCVIIGVDKRQGGEGARAIQAVWNAVPHPPPVHAADMVIAVDASVDVHDLDEAFFHLCANTDPGRDLIRHEDRIGLDGTRKLKGDERNGQPVRDYPPLMVMSDAIKTLVDDRWIEYGFRRRD